MFRETCEPSFSRRARACLESRYKGPSKPEKIPVNPRFYKTRNPSICRKTVHIFLSFCVWRMAGFMFQASKIQFSWFSGMMKLVAPFLDFTNPLLLKLPPTTLCCFSSPMWNNLFQTQNWNMKVQNNPTGIPEQNNCHLQLSRLPNNTLVCN